MNNEIYDLRVQKGTTHLLCGPSNSGKTYRVVNLLRIKDQLIKEGESIKNIVFCYAAWQPIYSELKNENIVTHWINYLPTNEEFKELVAFYKDKGGSIVVNRYGYFTTNLSGHVA